MKDLLRLVDYIKPYWRRVAGAILSAVMISVCWLALLGLVQPILDEVLPKTAAAPAATQGRFHLLDQARATIDSGAARFPFLARWSETLHNGSRGTIVLVGVLIVLIFLFKGVFTYLTAYLTRWTGMQAVRDLRRDLYAKIQRQSLAFFSEHSTGHLLSRILGDVGRLQRTVSGDLAEVFRLLAMVIGQSAYLFYLNWRLAGF